MKIKNIVLMLLCILAFSACKDNINIDLPDSTVYLVKSGEVTSAQFSSLDSATYDCKIYAYCSGFYAADVPVNMTVDNAALSNYNAAKGTALVALPESCYSIVNSEGKITKERRSAAFLIRFNCIGLKALGSLSNYVVPVSIKTDGSVAINSKIATAFIKPNMKD